MLGTPVCSCVKKRKRTSSLEGVARWLLLCNDREEQSLARSRRHDVPTANARAGTTQISPSIAQCLGGLLRVSQLLEPSDAPLRLEGAARVRNYVSPREPRTIASSLPVPVLRCRVSWFSLASRATWKGAPSTRRNKERTDSSRSGKEWAELRKRVGSVSGPRTALLPERMRIGRRETQPLLCHGPEWRKIESRLRCSAMQTTTASGR